MSSIVIAGDTSGTITLSAPAVAGSNTISLPAVTGTILTTAYTGAVTFDGDFTVDTDTLHVDSTNNRVGIGKTNPTTALDVVGTVTATAFAGALTGNVTGDVSGNAGTVTNGVYTTDIGSTVQAYDADLTTLAGLSSADGNFIVGSATGWVVESGATARTSLGLGTAATTASTDYATAAQGTTADSALQPADIGSTVQGYDADLTTLAGLSSADGNFIVGSATGWVVESGATARTSLGLGSIATQNSNSVTITGGSVTGITDLTVADGGTGASSITANSVILGNGTSALSGNLVAPGTSGNILTSNGTTWTSTAPAASGGFDAGTLMLFQQTAAPTGWTKQTTHNNKALRVVSGTASSGGSVAFTTAFASQTPTGSVTITSVTGSAGATTLSTAQMPAHNHTRTRSQTVISSPNGYGILYGSNAGGAFASDNTGGGGSHNHPFSFTSGAGTFSGSAIDLAVQYVDLIIASKD